MEKEFVDYQTALALKELGFEETCFAWYHPNMYLVYSITKDKDSIVNAPLYQQVFRFFREKYKLDSSYGTTSDSNEEIHGYVICNFIGGTRNHLAINWEVGNYEEAELECIKKLIELCQTKK